MVCDPNFLYNNYFVVTRKVIIVPKIFYPHDVSNSVQEIHDVSKMLYPIAWRYFEISCIILSHRYKGYLFKMILYQASIMTAGFHTTKNSIKKTCA